MTNPQEPKDAITPEWDVKLLAELPGRVSTEVMLDWPCEGQVSLVWWDTTPEQVERDNLHHFEGFDYRVLHDDTDTAAPVWRLLRAAPDLARAYLTQADALARAQEREAGLREEIFGLRKALLGTVPAYRTWPCWCPTGRPSVGRHTPECEQARAALAAAPEGKGS